MRRRQLTALVRKDLRLELRTRETIVAMVLFAIVSPVSSMRLEKPHSLSYHAKTLTNRPCTRV